MCIRLIFYLDRPEIGICFRHYFSTSLPNMLSEGGVRACMYICAHTRARAHTHTHIYIYKAGDNETERDKVYADDNWFSEHTNIIKKKLH